MFMVFNMEGALVAMVTLYGGEYTNILEILEDARYTVKFLDNENQVLDNHVNL